MLLRLFISWFIRSSDTMFNYSNSTLRSSMMHQFCCVRYRLRVYWRLIHSLGLVLRSRNHIEKSVTILLFYIYIFVLQWRIHVHKMLGDVQYCVLTWRKHLLEKIVLKVTIDWTVYDWAIMILPLLTTRNVNFQVLEHFEIFGNLCVT